MASRLADDTFWVDQNGHRLPIDSMDAQRVQNLLKFLERRYKIRPDEYAEYGWKNIYDTPLYQALMGRLPIATQEQIERAERKAKQADSSQLPSTQPAYSGPSLDQLNGAQKQGLKKDPAQNPQSNPQPNPKAFMDTDEAASYLEVSPQHVRTLARRGAIQGERSSRGDWMFPVDSVQAYAQSRRPKPSKGPKDNGDRVTAALEAIDHQVRTLFHTPKMMVGHEHEHDSAAMTDARARKMGIEPDRASLIKQTVPPIIDVLREIHDNIIANIERGLTAQSQGISKGHENMVDEFARLMAKGQVVLKADITEYVDQKIDALERSLANRIAQMHADVLAPPKKGKRR